MQNIKVNKKDLLKIMKDNCEEHRNIFLDAQKKYREIVISTLDQELASVRNGAPFVIDRITHLIQPSDHTDDYKLVIGMLEMDIAELVELTSQEFQCYVEDNWGWMGQFANQVSNYGITSPKLARYL